jgi:DNA-binding MarR family transcriptional regulator
MPKPEPGALDLGYLSLFVGYAYVEKVQAELAKAGFDTLRFSHGFVIQHLIDAERTIGELATRMDVTQQAASKVVLELEQMGYLERVTAPDDARVRYVRLSRRGTDAVAAARRVRARLEQKLIAKHGQNAVARCRGVLADVLESLGGVPRVRARRVASPR